MCIFKIRWKSNFVEANFSNFDHPINLPWGHMRSHSKFGPDRYGRFDLCCLQTNRQTDKQTILRDKRLNDLIYRNQIVCGILHGPMQVRFIAGWGGWVASRTRIASIPQFAHKHRVALTRSASLAAPLYSPTNCLYF